MQLAYYYNKAMKKIFQILLLFLSVNSYSQTERFFKLYDFNNHRNYFQGVVELNNKYYSTGVSNSTINKGFIVCVNNKGERIWQKVLLFDSLNSTFSGFTRIDLTLNSTLLASGTVGYRDTSKALDLKTHPILIEIDTNGNILNEWFNFEYYDTLNFGQRAYQLASSNYILGTVSFSEDQKESNPSLILTDSLGNQITRKDYAIYTNKNKVALNDFIPLNDKGYLMLGYVKAVTSSNYNGMLIRVDSNLNVVWRGEYGNSGFDEITSGIQLKDGHLLVCGLKDNPNGQLNHRDAWLMKINISNGNIVREKTFTFKIYNSFRGLTEKPDGSIVIAGGVDSLDSLSSNAHIVKLTPQWDILWSHNYGLPYISGKTTSNENVFGFTPTSDGGFMLVGFSFDPSISNPTQDAMLLKVDSNGCLTEGCTYTGIEQEQSVLQEVTLYPNPANEVIKISLPHSELQCNYEIINTLGEIIYKGELIDSEINIQSLSNGMYLLRVYTKRGIQQLKFVKE